MINIYSKKYLLGSQSSHTHKLDALKKFYIGNGYELEGPNRQNVYNLSKNYSRRRAANNSFDIQVIHAADGKVYCKAKTTNIHFYSTLGFVVMVAILTFIFDWIKADSFNTFLKHNIWTNVVAWGYFFIAGTVNINFVKKDLEKIL